MKRQMNLQTAARRMTALTQIGGLMKRRMMTLLMMLAVSIGFGLAGAQSANAAAGGKIAFTSQRDGNFEIYVMNADGSN